MTQQQQQQQPQATKEVDWGRLLNAAGPYPVEAFTFVREGLSFTSTRLHGDCEPVEKVDRHINGQQLCMGLRDFAIHQYGLMAPVVMDHWNVRRTDDFGRIVFAMIDEGLMSKTADDTIADFRAVFDFEEAFSRDQLLPRLAAD